MGATFRASIVIIGPEGKSAQMRAMVDCGAEFTKLPAVVLGMVGAAPTLERTLTLANGQKMRRGIGLAVLRIGARECTDYVAFGHPKDVPVIGARTLARMGLVVDTVGKRLLDREESGYAIRMAQQSFAHPNDASAM